MKTTLFTAICIASLSCLSNVAQAQCPAGLTSPLQLIDGQSWVFQTESDGNGNGQASIGRFTAKFVQPTTALPFGRGTLAGSQTFDVPPYVTAESAITGTYTIDPDCSGGTVGFNVSTEPSSWRFVFVNGFTEMYFAATQVTATTITNAANGIDDSERRPRAVTYSSVSAWGAAKLLASPIVCPAGIVTSLDVLNGSTYGVGLTPAAYYSFSPPSGVANIKLSEGVSRGTANIVTTGVVGGTVSLSPYAGSSTIQNPLNGRYTVDADCTGGTISFGAALLPQTFQFVFVNPQFTEMFLLSLDGTNPYSGHAKKF
jgi:hypothetical protein